MAGFAPQLIEESSSSGRKPTIWSWRYADGWAAEHIKESVAKNPLLVPAIILGARHAPDAPR